MSTLSNGASGNISAFLVNDNPPPSDSSEVDSTAENRVLTKEDELVFPMSKGAFAQYWEDEETPRELRVFYRDKEISSTIRLSSRSARP
jgi:hypothetical protein